MSSFDSKQIIRDRFGNLPILFELIPPPMDADDSVHKSRHDNLVKLKEELKLQTLNLPEVQEESAKDEKGERKSDFKTRYSPREYADKLSREVGDLNFVINRVIVKEPTPTQEDWLLDTFHDFNIKNLIVVGGESSDIDYPGPSVSEANNLITKYLNNGRKSSSEEQVKPTKFLVGNICIPTRRKEDFDEPDRMIKKIQSGADFFTSQIIAQKDSALSLLEDLSQELDRKNIDPPFIFWSFSPIEQQKDVNFLRWLGVKIPDSVEEKILSSDQPVDTSIHHAKKIWNKLNKLNQKLPVKIPLGINISFMGDRNFENALELTHQLKSQSSSPLR